MKSGFYAFIFLFFFYTIVPAQETVWGVTSNGGNNDIGTIGHYIPAESKWVTDFGDFTLTSPGSNLQELTFYNNKFYGLASGVRNGIIIEWDPITNTYEKKAQLDGNSPQGPLILRNGKFYGITLGGGLNNMGTIFEWDPVSSLSTKKYDFSIANGYSTSNCTMTLYNDKFYGVATHGGSNSAGVIFEWDPASNVYIKKIDINPALGQGSGPIGSLSMYNGKFYGATSLGGALNFGVIFEWDPATNVYTKKVEFNAISAGRTSGNFSFLNDKFYGVLGTNQTSFGGTIFEWDPNTNDLTAKINLAATVPAGGYYPDGYYPGGKLIYVNNKFYGLTTAGGENNFGVLFEWDPVSNEYLKKIDLTDSQGRYSPSNPVLTAPVHLNGKLYGTTPLGGNGQSGVIYEWDLASNVYSKKIDLNYAVKGRSPSGSLNYFNGKFYGTTSSGGTDGYGVLFEWDPATATYTKKIDFTAQSGGSPYEMTLYNDKFYGMTFSGGADRMGVIFEWDPSSNQYTKKLDLTVATGNNLFGAMVERDGKFYGVTQNGGQFGHGMLFELDPVTSQLTNKYSFNPSVVGGIPVASLAYHAGKFYSVTQIAATNPGTLFEWDPVTMSMSKKWSFSSSTGATPRFVMNVADKLYGTTQSGGTNGSGVIFEWDLNSNTYTKKIDFETSVGRIPGKMVSNGVVLYGSTLLGGANGVGVFFEWAPANNLLTKKIDLTVSTGTIPGNVQPLLINGLRIFQKIAFTSISSKTFNQSAFELTAISTSGLPISYTSSDPAIASISGSTVTIHKAGTITITASQPGNAYYLPATAVGQSLMINKGTQTLDFASVPTKTLGDTPFNLMVTSTSGLAVSFNSTSDKVTLSGSQATIVKPGSVIIRASQSGNESYNAAVSVDQTFCINPAKPTITLSNVNTETPTLTSSATTGNQWYLNNNAIMDATEVTYSATGAGIYKVQVKADNCLSVFSSDTPLIVTGDLKNVPVLINVFPNPVEDYLMISGMPADVNECVIIDMAGRSSILKLERQDGIHRGDVHNYRAGLYLTRVPSGNGIQQIEFIKK